MTDKMKGILGLLFLLAWSPVIFWTIKFLAKSCSAMGRPWYLC